MIAFQIETHIRLHYIDIRDYIEDIKIKYEQKSIELIVTQKKGLFIGSKGKNINLLIFKLNEKYGEGWKISIPDKLLGRIYNKKKSGKLRPTIIKDGLPLSSPFSSLKDDKMVQRLSSHIEEGNTVLITLFRDTVKASKDDKLREIKGIMGQNKLNFFQRLEHIFPHKTITLLEWPDIYRSSQDMEGSSHPLVSYLCRAAAVISNNVASLDDLEKCQCSLIETVHRELLTRAKNNWTILGDETGSLAEFHGKDPDDVSSKMCWIAIPPNTNLNPLDPDYHCSGFDGIMDYEQGINSLYDFDSIMLFTFEFEEGNITGSTSKIVNDPHLSFWLDSLPLVLEKISQTSSENIEVDIFVEQVGPLQSGIKVIETLVAELRGNLDNRKGWNHMSFSELWVISKGEHPWIGYADLLGAIVNNKKKVSKETAKRAELIRNRIHKSPFRQSSLNGVVNQALRETARPLSFLKFIYEIAEEDIRDYIKPFLGPALNESISALSQGDWQKLLEHMDTHSSSKQGQYASELIHAFVDIDSEINKLSHDKDRFDFALAMLGTSNHIGARDQAAKCISICNELLNNGYKPRKNREIKFKNLRGGVKDNQFDFSHIDEDLVLPTEDEFNEEWNRYLGAQALSRALRPKDGSLEFAIEIEEYLLRNTTDFNDLKRRWIMRAELQFEVGDFDEAMSALEYDLPGAIDSNVGELLGDGYYLASLLKGYTLCERPKSDFNKFSSAVASSLNEHHPSQRIAYWCLRWANQVDENNSDIAIKCKDHLLKLKDEPLFTHDAPGVILACELLDLESRGFPFVDTESFMKLVLANSAETTREWVNENPPNEYDWLAPLNFNYR